MGEREMCTVINAMDCYLDRARRLRQCLETIDDPLAHTLLQALIGAYEEAAAEVGRCTIREA
jgi:hypothetical protein